MGGFGDVFFEVDAVELDNFTGGFDVFLGVFWVVVIVEGDASAEAEGEVHLGNLVVFRHVWVEVVFTIPEDGGWGGAAEEHAGEDGALNGEFIQDGEGAGESEAGGAGVGVRLVGEGGLAPAEHFGVCFDLAMNL